MSEQISECPDAIDGAGTDAGADGARGARGASVGTIWTIRGLDRRDRRTAHVVAALIAVPYVVAGFRAHANGWLPSGDAGMIGLFARDVLHGHPPLLNTPTTADIYGNGPPTHHPGPIQFYALALPMFLFGSASGMLAWTVFANVASVMVASWAVFRRCGPSIGLWAAVVVSGVAWSQGPAVLVDPINSDAGAISLIALVVLVWAVACGDRRLVPLLALWSAYYSQLHLVNLPIGLALSAVAVVAVLLRVAADRRDLARAGRPSTGHPWWPWLAGGLAVSLVLWAPVIIDALFGDPSNVRLTWEYSRQGDRNAVGWTSGLRQVGHALDPRALILRNGIGAEDLLRRPSLLDAVLSFVVLVGLVGIAVFWRRRSQAISLLAATTLVLAAVGLVVGAQVPIGERDRLGFYRWTFMVSAIAMISVGAAAIDLACRRRWVRRERMAAPARAAGVALVAALALGASLVAAPAHGREDVLWGMEQRVSDAVLPEVKGRANVYVVPYGTLAARSLAMPLALDLESHGHHVSVPDYEARNYGKHRSPRRARPDIVVVLDTSRGPAAPGPGRLVVQVSTDQRWADAFERLLDQAKSAPVVVSPEGDSMALREGLEPDAVRLWIRDLDAGPSQRLQNRQFLRLIAGGYLTSPRFDPAAIATLLRRDPPRVWSQDTVQVTILTPEQYEAAYGPIK